MEIIRKKICLDEFKSHICGKLPFCSGSTSNISASGENGNFGWFVMDKEEERTTNMMKKYNIVLDILRHSLHLKHLKNFGCTETGVYNNRFSDNFQYNGTTDDFIFNENVGVYYLSAFTKSGNYYTYDGDDSHDYVILISDDDAEIYNRYGGYGFVISAHTIIYDSGSTGYDKIPYIPINVLLVNSIDEIGIMSLYEDDTVNEDIFPKDYSESNNLDWFEKKYSGECKCFNEYLDWDTLTQSGIVIPPGYKEYAEDDENIPKLESKLMTLREKLYFQDDNGYTIASIFEDFPGIEENKTGKFFKCYYCTGETIEETVITYVKESTATTWNYSTSSTTITEPWFKHDSFRNYLINLTKHGEDINTTTDINPDETVKTETTTKTIEYSWWEPEETSGDDLSCADDENVNPNEEKYRTLTVFETLVYSLAETYTISDGDYFYFLIKYDNAEDIPARIPFTVGLVMNKEMYEYEDTITYVGDFVSDISFSGDYIEFTYILGAIFTDENYDINTFTGGTIYKEIYPYLANTEGVIDIDGYSGVSYWYDYIDFENTKQQIINRDFNITKKVNIAKILGMTAGDVWKKDGSVYNSPLMKEDYLMGITLNPVTEINVEINRGNAAAFESHFRLTECNSYSDIEENGNGGFFTIE